MESAVFCAAAVEAEAKKATDIKRDFQIIKFVFRNFMRFFSY
jgi:hypothetical protein